MRLTKKKILGQGNIGAVAGMGRKSMVVAAAINNHLAIFSGLNLKFKTVGPARHKAKISALCSQPHQEFVKPTTVLVGSSGLDGKLALWGLNSKLTPLLSAEQNLDCPVHDLSWSAGPQDREDPFLAAALDDGRIALWRPEQESLEYLDVCNEPLHTICFFPDGQHLATSGIDGVLRIVELPSGAQAKGGLLKHYNAIHQVRVSSCGRYVAFCSEDERGALFDLSTRRSQSFGREGDSVASLAWHPDLPQLVIGTSSGRNDHYDASTGKLTQNDVLQHLHPAESCAWAPSGNIAWTAGRDGSIFSARLNDQGNWGIANAHAPTPHGYALSVGWAGEKKVVAGWSDGRVCMWHKKSSKGAWKRTSLEKHHSKPVYGLDISPNRKIVASGSVDKTVKVWDLAEEMQVFDLAEIHKRPVYSVAFSPDSRFVATGSADTYLVVYDMAKVKKAAEEEMGRDEYWHFAVRNRIVNCVDWAPDGKHLAVGLSNHTVVLLPVNAKGKVTKGPTLTGHDDNVSAVAFSADSKRLVSVGYDRRVVVWDAQKPEKVVSRVVEHEEPIQALALHPKGEIVATGSWDGTIRLWSMADLSLLYVARNPHFSAVEDLEFDREGKRLVSASSDGTLGIWDLREK